MRPFIRILLPVALLCLMLGCASKIPHKIVPEYGKRGARLVAVLPVVNKTSDEKAAQMLRIKSLEALYYKGYPKIPLQVIDEKIATVDKKVLQDVKALAGLLGVDAVMNITLEECNRSVTLLYARTSAAAGFEMRSAGTGEVLWEVRYRTGERNFDITKKRAELRSVQIYEPMIQEIIDRVMETLPDGPDM